MGRERPGEHAVLVEERATRQPVARMMCLVPQSNQIRPTPRGTTATPLPRVTATATTGGPVTPIATPLASPSATPTLPPPSFTSCGAPVNDASAPNYPIRIVTIDKGDETVTLQNVTTSDVVSLDQWRMCSITGGQQHLGIAGTLDPGESRSFRNSGGPIWNDNDPDDGALFDAQGRLVSYWRDP